MIKKYFHIRKVRLLKDIARMMGEKAYSYLDEVEPELITQIPLVKVGVWLKLEDPISQFSSDQYMQDIERRMKRLSQWDWKRFNEEVTGMPDNELIESEEENYIFSKISAFLSDKADRGLDIPDEPLGQLNDALFSRMLQNEMCAWFNASEFQKCLIQMEGLESNSENPILLAYWEFNKAVKDILEAWYKERGIAVPKSDMIGITKEFARPKKVKPRRIGEYPHLRDHINTVFPDLIRKLLGDKLPVDEIFPEGVTVTDDEKEYLINVFKQRLWKHDKYKQYKKENKRLNEVSTTEGGKCFTIVEDRPPSEDGLKEISPVK